MAEGSAQLGAAQALSPETALGVDVLRTTERIVWTGVGSVRVAGPDGSSMGTFAAGARIVPAAGVGAYELRPTSRQPAGGTWSVVVEGAGTDEGRLFSLAWALDGGTFDRTGAMNASFYALVDDGAGSGVVELRFAGLAGFEYLVFANDRGIGGATMGQSVPAGAGSASPGYRLYLRPPAVATYTFTAATVADAAFRSGAGLCNVALTGTGGGEFVFTASRGGRFAIVCDTNADGVFDPGGAGDVVTSGDAVAGANTVPWRAVFADGRPLPAADLACVVLLRSGEVHWIGDDIETCYPGLRMFAATTASDRAPLAMLWDDGRLPAGVDEELMADGRRSAATPPAGGLQSGAPASPATAYDATLGGNARAWGSFMTVSKGNNALLDTYVWMGTDRSSAVTVATRGPRDDTDVDGTPDVEELCVFGTDPLRSDSDDGGRSDGQEIKLDGTDPLVPADDIGFDWDRDGLTNDVELLVGTDPTLGDTDGDGRSDGDELRLAPLSDALLWDTDSGGRSDGEEVDDGTDPNDPGDDNLEDLDGDGLSNDAEIVAGTDPADPDTDNDGRNDFEELTVAPRTDPLVADTDAGGRSDGEELADGTSSHDPADDLGFDFDRDGLLNEIEPTNGTDPANADSDVDLRLDGEEVHGLPPSDPLNPDSDGGGAGDGREVGDGTDPTDPTDDVGFDYDSDGVNNEIERRTGTDPTDPDSDGDGLCDGGREGAGVCSVGEDRNGNGLVDQGETDPRVVDTDGDGICDGPIGRCGTPVVSGGALVGCSAAATPPSRWSPTLLLGIVVLLRNRRRRADDCGG